jgi:hypothetical protein
MLASIARAHLLEVVRLTDPRFRPLGLTSAGLGSQTLVLPLRFRFGTAQKPSPQEDTVDTEYWGTFSIYDYQTPRYRQSLVLFDKVVIPLPTAPIGGVTAQEIERLSAEVAYLEKEGLAVGVQWDRNKFEAWRERTPGAAESFPQPVGQEHRYSEISSAGVWQTHHKKNRPS